MTQSGPMGTRLNLRGELPGCLRDAQTCWKPFCFHRGEAWLSMKRRPRKARPRSGKKDAISGEVVEGLGSNRTESQTHFLLPWESSEPNLVFGMKPT